MNQMSESICQTDPDGTKAWYRDGKLHREDGPAVEYANGIKCWFRDGKYHREDGPAYEGADGTKYWYYQGTEIKVSNLKEFRSYIRNKAFW